MRNLVTQHPDDGLLLRYIDGELPVRKVRQVKRHLEACWQCRTELEELQSTVAGCVRYRKNVLQTYLPDPPNPWPDLYRDFARIDSSSMGESWLAQLVAILGSARVRQWTVGAAAALVMVGVIWYQFREAPPVEAAVLLKRAVLAAESRSLPARRVQMRTRDANFVRTRGTRAPASSAALEAKFVAARYDFDDPLSAHSFASWRETVPAPARHDEVTTVADPQTPALSCYRIRTTAADGELASASLMLRTNDLRPVSERLEFRDQNWVELTDITDATTSDGGTSAATNVELPVRGDVPSHLPATLSRPASISDELQVLAALHGIGADLGDPVEVNLVDGRVAVGGVGIAAERQQQIRALFDQRPNVVVNFADPTPASVPASAEAAAAETRAGTDVPEAGLTARVEKQLGGHDELQKFSSQVLDRSESLMSHAYALRRLAERFPVDANMTAQDRETLHQMARQDAAEMAREATTLDHTLRPVLNALGAKAGGVAATMGPEWQGQAQEAFRASHRLEVLVSQLLGVAPGNAAAGDILAALNELRADLDSCQRLLQ